MSRDGGSNPPASSLRSLFKENEDCRGVAPIYRDEAAQFELHELNSGRVTTYLAQSNTS